LPLDPVPAIHLLKRAQDPQEREAVGIVALLDVPDDEVV
jgi:hypothetical protein